MTRPSFTADKFVGTAKECFDDLMAKYPDVQMRTLLAEFCDVRVSTVHRWNLGEFSPSGANDLRLRCFLQLAGYDVQELRRLNEDARYLAYAIAFGAHANVIADKLGYTAENNQGVWSMVLRGTSYSGKKMPEVVDRHLKRDIHEKQKEWRTRIAALKAELSQASPDATPPAPPVAVIDPALATSFARLVGATTSLGTALAETPATRQAVVAATRHGADLQELIELLQRLLEPEQQAR